MSNTVKYSSKILSTIAFVLCLLSHVTATELKTIDEWESQIAGLVQTVKDQNAYIDAFDEDTPHNLPVGIKKTLGGMDMTIILDSAVCTESSTELQACMAIEFAGSEKPIMFRASKVKFTAGGFVNARMQLVSRRPINLGNMVLRFDPRDTYVDFDCNGYRETSLSAIITLPTSMFKKEDSKNRTIIPTDTVTATFKGTFTNLNDIIVSATIDPFQLSVLAGFGFYADDITIDFSDERNPSFGSVTYSYVSKEFGKDANLWRGVYISSFEMKLPKSFCKDNNGVGIAANDMLIDDNGITGNVAANNVLPRDKGDLGGWQFSISNFTLTFSSGNLDKLGFGGDLVLPVSETPSPMKYEAHLSKDGSYEFSVTPPKTTKFDIWAAEIALNENTKVKVSKTKKETTDNSESEEEFIIGANLYGKMTIAVKDSKVNVADIEFNNMSIQNVAPKFGVESFTAKVGDMKGFPIQISKLGYSKNDNKKDDDRHGLELGVTVSFMNDEDKGFGATGNFIIYGKENPEKGIASWKYDKTEFKSFELDIQYTAFKMKGSLAVYNSDKVYGDGMKGKISMTILEKIGVEATAQFGNVDGFKYWYADAFASFTPGIPVFTAVTMNGFGGGAFYHMNHVHDSSVEFDSKTVKSLIPTSEPGQFASADIYKPDKNVGIGLNASVLLAIGSESVLNVKAGFEISFTTEKTLNQVLFTGEALLLTEYTPNVKPEDTKMYAKMLMKYDNKNKSFFGSLDTYLNIAGVVTGAQSNNYAGHGEIYFGEGKWKIFMGTPDNPIGIKFLKIAEAQSYFVTGNFDIPGIPAPPSNVSSILGRSDFSFCRNVNQLSNGGGFAFGASLKVAIPKRTFLCFYGSFDAGVGFDLMLVNYGKDAKCAGSNDVLGINGWYASGQTYAYVQGDIGITCKIFKKKRNVSILDIGVAAILQAQLPNPLYMSGEVGGYYNVLGGLIKGHCNFKFDVGEECEIQRSSNVLDNIDVISDMTPRNGSDDVDVFSSPQVTFNYTIDQEFEMIDDVDNTKHKFRIKFDHFEVKQGSAKVKGDLVWNSDHNVVAFESFEVLPGKSDLTASVKVHFEEYKNNVWAEVKDDDGAVFSESRDVTFKTGDLPDYIPTRNIATCYPLINQTNYYSKEHNTGHITLKKGQSYLFDKPAGERWSTEYRYSEGSSISQNVFTYNSSTKTLSYQVPASLKNETVYDVTIVNIPIAADDRVDANVKTKTVVLSTGDTITTRATDGTTRASADEKIILAYKIRTSKYNTFTAKVNSLSYEWSSSYAISTAVHRISRHYSGSELFSVEEISAQNPMVRCSFVTSGNDWYQNKTPKYIYNGYPIHSSVTLDRLAQPLGIPPINSFEIYQSEDIQMENGLVGNMVSSYNVFDCYFEYYVAQDYMDLKTKAANSKVLTTNSKVASLAYSTWSSMSLHSKYYFNVSYYIPGQTTPTSTHKLYIEY
ncbi:MAG: hypothetical protein IKW77_07830 [Salinivirgaceae bacterium]|nr:hypothetical protein [Salinivirgaceae bacterium]